MTAVTETEPGLRAVILNSLSDAWQVYRRSQQIPFPANPGNLMKAQSRLWHQVEPHTRTDDRNPLAEPDVDAIDDAVDALVASVEWSCGSEAAAFVSGEKGEQ